jgi:hypothetical protein
MLERHGLLRCRDPHVANQHRPPPLRKPEKGRFIGRRKVHGFVQGKDAIPGTFQTGTIACIKRGFNAQADPSRQRNALSVPLLPDPPSHNPFRLARRQRVLNHATGSDLWNKVHET